MMRKFIFIIMAVVLCFAMTSCSKQTGTYTANCKNVMYGEFTLTMELKADGKFTLKPNSKENELLNDMKYSGTYEIEKSNDGSEYDTLILTYNEYSQIEGGAPNKKTKRAKINTKGTKIELTNFYGESKIIFKK